MGELTHEIVNLNIKLDRLIQNISLDGTKQSFTLADRVLFVIASLKVASPTQITSELGIVKSNLVPIVQRLTSSGLVEVGQDANDGRAVKYYLTDKGKSANNKRIKQVEEGITLNAKRQKQALKLVLALNDLI